jgi:hypothetical protein
MGAFDDTALCVRFTEKKPKLSGLVQSLKGDMNGDNSTCFHPVATIVRRDDPYN